jgi:dolichol-phosphate mannosyltransferase
MDRRVLDVYQRFEEDPRFFRGLISWVGFRQIGVPFVRCRRAGGQTKYRYSRLVKLAFDTITAFSTLPALYVTLLAAGLAGMSFCSVVVITFLWAIGAIALEGWMWASMGFLILWNVQFLALAVLGEYVVRTHRNTQRRPLFVVETVIENVAPEKGYRTSQTVDQEKMPLRHPSALAASETFISEGV